VFQKLIQLKKDQQFCVFNWIPRGGIFS